MSGWEKGQTFLVESWGEGGMKICPKITWANFGAQIPNKGPVRDFCNTDSNKWRLPMLSLNVPLIEREQYSRL